MPQAARMDGQAKAQTVFAETQASVLLDLVRGLAALLVLVEHWRNLLFVDYPSLRTHKMALAPLYLLTGAGHQAVVIFFVLSGYLISGSVFRSLERRQWSWASYLTHRLVRLWIVVLPGLLLCVLWDETGLAMNWAPLLYSGLGQSHMIGDIRHLVTPGIFAGNALFLQVIVTPMLGSDGALWSLAFEFWYYILFPLGLLTLWRGRSAASRLASAVGFVAVAWFVRGGILKYFPVWLLGVALAAAPAPRVGARTRWIAAAAYVPFLFFVSKYHGLDGIPRDYVLAVMTTAFLWVLLSAEKPVVAGAVSVRAVRRLSRFSFTLYVAHTPFLLLLVSLAQGDTRWTPDAAHIGMGLILLAITVAYCYALAWGTEFRTDTVRRWVERRLGISKRPARNPHEAALSQ